MKDWLGSDRLDEAVEIPKAMRPKKMRRLFHSARDSRFDGEKTPVKTTVTTIFARPNSLYQIVALPPVRVLVWRSKKSEVDETKAVIRYRCHGEALGDLGRPHLVTRTGLISMTLNVLRFFFINSRHCVVCDWRDIAWARILPA
jgi:hypothetical protein